ncbi:polysaccharide biosynthesis/export family protein [Tundrisphaera sp. TA3]|uniref:polysaccharide biosynthesis/export family protein n=1 Tax=Tundrisphaera sp. TA3 TaxID=3435775 RepID=UPI003EBD5B93
MDRSSFDRRWIGSLALLAALMATGCQTVKTPEEQIAKSNIPRELDKVSMPDYVVEPPDILIVEVLEALPGRPITGERLVRPDGKISLGFYGDVYVAGLTLDEIKEKIILHLRKDLTDEVLGLVRLNNETGQTEEVEPAKTSRVFVDIGSYNSKVYYVQGDVGSPGRLPITGNETVLDAIQYAGGLIPTASVPNIRLVRPAPPGACCEQTLPINITAIVNAGDTTTNYQLMPGDRIVVYRDPIVRTTLFIDRLAAPFNSVLNTIFQYGITARTVKTINAPLFPTNNTGTGTGTNNGGTTPVTNLNIGSGAR